MGREDNGTELIWGRDEGPKLKRKGNEIKFTERMEGNKIKEEINEPYIRKMKEGGGVEIRLMRQKKDR